MTATEELLSPWMDAISDLELSNAVPSNVVKVADGLLALALRGDSAVFYATTKGIARFSGFSPSTTTTITRALDVLVERGLVERQKGHGNKPSIYRLVVPSTTA